MVGSAKSALVSVDVEDGAVFAGIRARRRGQRGLKIECSRLEPGEARLFAKWLMQAANMAEGKDLNTGLTFLLKEEPAP